MPLTSLPPELWRRIIYEATSPRGGLVTSWTHAPSEKLFRGWEDEIESEDQEIATKMAVVRVCKGWRDIGIEFLYQWVKLSTRKRTRELVDLFRANGSRVKGSTMTSGESESVPGSMSVRNQPAYSWWVKRVDVVGVMIEGENLDEVFIFLELCSQVEVVFNVPPFGYFSDESAYRFACFQANYFRNSLRHLALSLPNLASIPAPPPSPITTLGITSLTLYVALLSEPIVPDWHFPALRFVKLFEIRDVFVARLFPFFDRYGAQLIGLHIQTTDIFDSITSILSRTPSLKSLVLNERILGMARQYSGKSFPSVSHLGIQLGYFSNVGEYDRVAITEHMENLFSKRILPGLTVVRLLSDQDPAALEGWSTLLAMCKSRSIILDGTEQY